MPRFHFNIRDGEGFEDDTGMVLADVDAARSAAVRYAGDCLRDAAKRFSADRAWRMDVTDEQGAILFALTFAATDASRIERR